MRRKECEVSFERSTISEPIDISLFKKRRLESESELREERKRAEKRK
jgi:hypothetical protein